ncbi:MAG: 6-bladed beta-propeller, partial [Segetibacter sp.]
TLLITSRNHNAFKRFTLDGKYIETISLPGSFVCRPVIKGKFIYAAVFRSETNMNFGSGYITILDENNRVISTPGGTEPHYVDNKLQPQTQQSKVFIHPHDVCIDDDENVYVCQWKADKTYPIKLERV